MAILLDPGIYNVEDSAGAVMAGALLYFYTTGTSTPLATYSNDGLSVANTNPVVADANGRFGAIYLQATDYKVVLKTAAGVTLVTRDPVHGTVPASSLDPELAALGGVTSAADKLPYFTGSGTAAVADFTAAARTLISQATQALMRSVGLGLGTASVLDETTAAQFQANTSGKVLSTDKVWGAADFVALTDAATIAVDMSTFINASVTLGGNRTLGNPSSTTNCKTGVIKITQDATGTRTLAYASNWKFAGGSAPVLTTTAAAVDLLFYEVISSTFIYATLVKDVK